MQTRTPQKQAERQGMIRLTADQVQAVSGATGIKIYIWEEGQFRSEIVFHPYLPTFPVKKIGSTVY